MSDTQNEHESMIKTPRQLIVAIAAAFLTPIIAIILLVQYVASDSTVGAGSDAMTKEAIAARLRPVADVGFTLIDPDAPAASAPSDGAPVTSAAPPAQPRADATADAAKVDGKKLYTASCAACHTPGIAGAPKTGDKAAWAPRIQQGADTLYAHALKGFQGKTGFMPPRGLSTGTDAEIKAAVDYMVSASK